MKTNFKCPKCKKGIRVGKKLHASFTCPNCHYTMVLSKEDVARGYTKYRPPYQVAWDPDRRRFKRPFNKNFQKSAQN